MSYTEKHTNLLNKTGMTFVEIMIAGLLMVVLFIIGWTLSNSFIGVKKVRHYETAMFLANQAIEAISAARSNELGKDGDHRTDTLLADFSSADDIYDKKGSGFLPVIKIGSIEYRRKLSITDCKSMNPNLDPKLKVIRVLVSWKVSPKSLPIEFEVVTTHCEKH